MKAIKVFGVALLFIGLAAMASAFVKRTGFVRDIKKPGLEGKGFALVELFTSEGCSSCPPADELVAKVEKEVADKPVYILAYHVDYWDRLGWKDIFSSAAYTKRQNDYAQWLNLSQIYTPQIVVNGIAEFVGSQEGALHNAISKGLEGSNNALLNISAIKGANNKVLVQYNVDGNIDKTHSKLLLALVQKHAVSKIKSGENAGRNLVHAQIVRDLQSLQLKNTGTATIALPEEAIKQDWEIIGFIQNNNNGAIIAATKGQLK
ncbi:DUF1223 domain-containing protein [Mucilaginibacter sp. CAU 1740]|uniref:DUF1223 domain-containing protein n=1 Tax=Mucilaginibacter sp. CAU 1740 TaxID=3140365 RepID=UPI00325A5364